MLAKLKKKTKKLELVVDVTQNPSHMAVKKKKSSTQAKNGKQNMQHSAFPRGPPPQYYLSSTLLNFAVRMGSGDPG